MNFDEYKNEYLAIYQDFANTVRFILDQALKADTQLPRPQSIQSRAKSVKSLRRRLVEQGKLETQTLETDRRDLAGARLIFYTNNDVDRFRASSIIRENFDVEDDSTKVHHPTPENKDAQYRAIHYTVRLREDRTRLPEYKRFAGLRCEIQVQTILNHAYAETSHDILYKNEFPDGYGKRAMEAIERRFERIMDDYLVPAGYEIQKAQREYERLLQGKELFDGNVGERLENAKNNNERYEILAALKDYALPNYDDLPAAFQGLKGPLLTTVKRVCVTEAVPIETTFGNLRGFTAEVVIGLIVDIVDRLRYTDVPGAFQLLIDIFREVTDERTRQRIVNVVKSFSEYNVDVYRQAGALVQTVLVEHLAAMSDADVDAIRPIALTVWREAIESDITGTKWRTKSVVWSSGAVPASEQIKEVRDKAIRALFAAYDRSTDDAQRREVLSALDAATRTPTRGDYSNELLAATLKDTKRIVDFAKDRAKTMSFALLQHLEHRFLGDYFRASALVDDPENKFGCQTEARDLVASILQFRDIVNTDTKFVRYKVLVGFESVYPQHWADRQFDYHGWQPYRRAEAERYIEEIDAANEADWFDLIERCAATKSNDMATFPLFGDFISNLAERKPEVADRLLAEASEDLRTFLAGFLNGLSRGGRKDIYERVFADELRSGRNLGGVARHIRLSDIAAPDLVSAVVTRAIETEDMVAVIECFLFAIEHFDAERIAEPEKFVGDALSFFNRHQNSSWVWNAWFLQDVDKFYKELTKERLDQILENLGHVHRIDHQVERILVRLAERWPEEIWDYFARRLAKTPQDGADDERFEAVPFEFHGLEKELAKNPQLAISEGLAWFKTNSELFQFGGGRVLSAAFPDGEPAFAKSLADLVRDGGETEADFALAILQNYKGEISTHGVLKEIVSKFADDKRRMSGVAICIDNTGVVSGELGFAQALRAKKESTAEWLTDERAAVREFAEKHIKRLDLHIADEHRRAEADEEMWNRDFEDDDDDDKREDGPVDEL